MLHYIKYDEFVKHLNCGTNS